MRKSVVVCLIVILCFHAVLKVHARSLPISAHRLKAESRWYIALPPGTKTSKNRFGVNRAAIDSGFTVKGIFVDQNQAPVEFATVRLYSAQELGNRQQLHDSVSLIPADIHPASQQVTRIGGGFSLKVKPGVYRLTLSYLGRLIYTRSITLMAADVDLKKIEVNVASQGLKEVVIKSVQNKPLLQADGRKLVYNVANSITAQGGNVLEALQKAPGVMVSQDNRVTLNGTNGTLILINGRQTYLQPEELGQLLKSMPSSNVKAIEIVKNPSAEYDAAGTGGVINIITKKPANDGFNGNLDFGLAYGKTPKQNANLSLNYHNKNLNVYGNAYDNVGHFDMHYDNDRITGGKIYINPNHDVDKRNATGITLGADYSLDTSQTIGAVLNYNGFNGPGVISPLTYVYDQASGRLLQQLVSESNYYHQYANRYNANLNYRYKGRRGQLYSVDADYGNFSSGTKNLNTNTYYDPAGNFESAANYRIVNNKAINLYAVKADYSAGLWQGRIAAGAKFSSVDADNTFDLYNVTDAGDVLDPERSNFFKYREQIAAAYLKYEGNVTKQLSYDAGLRMEHTHAAGSLQPVAGSSQQPAATIRNYTDLFPTGSITLKTEKAGIYGLSFARRVDRPAYNDLNPFEGPIDELSYWKGNPFLQPQYANTLAFQYSIKSTTASLSYTHTNHLSAQVSEVADGNRIIMMPENIGLQNNFNLTVTQQFAPAKWWSMTVTAMGYHIQNKTSNASYGYYAPHAFSGIFNTQQTLSLPCKISVEVTGVYNTNSITGLNVHTRGNSEVDIGLKRPLLKDRATLLLSVQDIYKGNKLESYTSLNGLYQHNTFTGEYRRIRVNFVYRFGNSKVKSQQQHESGLENENKRL